MASTATKVSIETTAGPAIVRPVEAPVPRCGECMYHMPHVTRAGGWCACKTAESKWAQVSERRPLCDAFAPWPEGSPVTRFLAAMRC